MIAWAEQMDRQLLERDIVEIKSMGQWVILSCKGDFASGGSSHGQDGRASVQLGE